MVLVRAMEVAMEVDETETLDDIDTLELMAGVAAGATPSLQHSGHSGKPLLHAGRSKCWIEGCDCTTGLEGIPPDRIADAQHVMQHDMQLQFGAFKGAARALPKMKRQNKLCLLHRPILPAKQIIGASVLIKLGGEFVPVAVT